MDRTTRIVHWNCQSLAGKKALLTIFLREQNIDILLVSETHLSKDKTFKIPNYHTYRKDEVSETGRAFRGLAVLVHRRIIHQLIPSEEFKSIQALGVLVNIDGQTRRLFAVYKPPHNSLIPAEITKLLDAPEPAIIAGDLNSHGNSSKTNRDKIVLLQDSVDHCYDAIGPDEPTNYHHNNDGTSPSVKD